MDSSCENRPQPSFVRRWGPYAIKAALLLGLLGIFAATAGTMPTVGIAIVWAALSTLCTLGATHRTVLRKLRRQVELKEDGHLARFNNGRILCMVTSFIVSAAGVATLLFAVPAWGVEQWCLAAAAAVLLPIISHAASRDVKKEFEPAFSASRTLLVATLATLAFLAVGSLAISFLTPVPQATTAAQAFQMAPQPFVGSPSALMSEAGKVAALVDGLSSFGLAQAAAANPLAYRAINLVVTLASLATLAGLLAVCLLSASEVKRVFQPLEAGKGRFGEERGDEGASRDGRNAAANETGSGEPSIVAAGALTPNSHASTPAHALVRKYVVTACVLPLALVGAFLAADHAAAQAVQTEEVTRAEAFVRDQVDLAVFVLDGAYYQYQGVQELMDATHEQDLQLAAQVQAVVEPMVNSFFDACLNNVDSYLDWYYSLTSDYEQLAQMVMGTAEEFAADQLASHLEEGVDSSGLDETFAQYIAQEAALKEDFNNKLEELKIDADMPTWLVTERGTLEPSDLLKVFEPTQQLMSRDTRLGTSGAAGVAVGITTGVVTKALVNKAAEKGFFKKIVEKVATKLGSKAVGTVVGEAVGGVVGGAAGGTAGSVVPGAGTVAGGAAGGVAGAAAGAAIGTAISVGVDYGLLKIDEWQYRDAYRQEIVDSIEEARAEALAALSAQDEGTVQIADADEEAEEAPSDQPVNAEMQE